MHTGERKHIQPLHCKRIAVRCVHKACSASTWCCLAPSLRAQSPPTTSLTIPPFEFSSLLSRFEQHYVYDDNVHQSASATRDSTREATGG